MNLLEKDTMRYMIRQIDKMDIKLSRLKLSHRSQRNMLMFLAGAMIALTTHTVKANHRIFQLDERVCELEKKIFKNDDFEILD